jgi:DNA-binding response OmpR family regulator
MTQPATILIIEDETALLYALNASLSAAGFRVLTSADGQEGLEQMTRQRPDFVILDIQLPTLSGLGILRARNQSSELKKIPVLVISNTSREQTIQEARRLGALDYLVKTDHSLEEIINFIKEKLAAHDRR